MMEDLEPDEHVVFMMVPHGRAMRPGRHSCGGNDHI
jgi:hypothetical protein